jgi:hypothetical protein
VQAATQKYALDPSYVPATLAIESAGGRNLGKRGNPGQFDQSTADAVGMPDATRDPAASVAATGALAAQNARELADRIGRQPTPAEVYLAHQQGVGGAAALINHPDEPAGKYVSPQNIASNGGDPNAPARNFVLGWQNKWNATARNLGFSPGKSVFASASPADGQGQASAAAGPTAGASGALAAGGIAAPIQVASASPDVPQPDTGAPGPAPTIAVPGFKGAFTRAQAEAQDKIEADADENDTVPEVPNTAEWDAAHGKQPAASPAPAAGPAGQPPSPAPAAPPAAPKDGIQAATGGFMERLNQYPLGDQRRITMLQQAHIMASQRALADGRWKSIADDLGEQLKIDRDIAKQKASPSDAAKTAKVMTADEVREAGLPAGGNYQKFSTGEIKPIGDPSQRSPEALFAARRAQIAQVGMDPKDPRAQQFILTGQMPDPNKFSPGEQKLISETDDRNSKLTMAVGALQKARGLLPQTRSGATSGLLTWVDRNDPTGIVGNAKTGAATTEYDNLIQSTALGSLKDVFGGRVTNYEDMQFQALQPNSGKSQEEKAAILEDLIKRYDTMQRHTASKLEQLQGKSYYGAKGPGGGAQPSTETQPAPGPSRQPSRQAATAAPQEGATATNRQTGERIIFKDGQWQALQ